MTRALLRALAVAIGIAAVVDPAITIFGAARARLAIVAQGSAAQGAERVRAQLVQRLGTSYEIVPHVTSDAAAAIVVGDRYPDSDVVFSGTVVTVTVGADPSSGIRIVRVDTPRAVPAATAIRVGVEVDGQGVSGRTTDVTVRIAGLEVGRASHRWAGDRERWRGAIDAVPLGEPPFLLQVALEKPGTTVNPDEAVDTLVDVRRDPLRVEFYDPRLSWASTFVRRALESDPRFHVETLSFSSREVAVRTRDAVPLNDRRLDAFDAVIVGGLDRLSAADMGSLDRYMRERGGSVVLVPDARPAAGALRRLLPIGLAERLLERPATLVSASLASIEASELLALRDLPPGSEAVANMPGSEAATIVASMPRGEGRLLVSGAMDAWRFRGAADRSERRTAGGAFDRFWQATVAGLALATPPPIDVAVVPPVLRQNDRADVIVRVRSRAPGGVSASIGANQPIRLRPEPEAGVFRGTWTAGEAPARLTIDVRAYGGQAEPVSRTVLVRSDARHATPEVVPPLSMLAASHRGIDVTADRLDDAERFIRNAVSSPHTRAVHHPMRSAWWFAPFAACLSAEWWLRRRRGLR